MAPAAFPSSAPTVADASAMPSAATTTFIAAGCVHDRRGGRAIYGGPGGPPHEQLVEDHRVRVRRTDATQQRQLDGEAARIEAEGEAEHVELEALLPTGSDACDSEHAHL